MLNRLELNWIGKYENKISPEPRIMYENAEYSYAKEQTGQIEIEEATQPTYGNLLIHGDNLLALKALENEYAGKVKCICIDPPYNTQSCFEQYDDNLEHSTWLTLMKPRLELLYNLLAEDGSIWICIDDDERDYLKILCDEVFNRNNFITACLWQKIHSIKNDAKYLSVNHDYILLYAKNKEKVQLNLLGRTDEMNKRYQNQDNDPRGPWQSGDLVANEERANGYYDVISPISGKVFNVPQGKHWVYSQENMLKLIEDNAIWFGKDGNAFPRKKRFLSDVQQGRKGDTWWKSDEVGHNQEAKREVKVFNPDSIFATPKPERLIERILNLSTDPGDIVLDSFLGSGTTAAVAHKMGRRWIGIELGNHAYTHCYPRLKAVVDGEQGGISKSVNWQGGGGFKFLELAPSLLELDENGHYIISQEYNGVALAAAMAMHKGYKFAPDENVYWKQGKQNEHNYIFTTTNYIYGEYLDKLFSEMEENETLLICCRAFAKECNARCKLYKRIRVQKIPDILFGRCEFGKDNYDLNIIARDIVDDTDDYEGEDE